KLPFSVEILNVVSILLLAGVLSAKRISSFPDYCFGDKDYEELLKIAKNGLGRATHPAKVVIVGAGISGLTAAKLLQDAGHKVTILESSNQLGGRIRTYRPKGQDWYVELGAMRLPRNHSIVREFIKQFKLPLNPFNLSDNKTWYLINGTRARAEEVNKNPDILKYDVKPTERGKNAEQLYREVLNKVRARREGTLPPSIEYLIKVGNLSRGAVQMIGDIMNEDSGFYLSFLGHQALSASLEDVRFYRGFDQLPKAFQKSLSNPIKFDCTVEKIVREGNEVHVFYRAPDTLDPTIVVADYVLVTSTTKATRLIQFQPPLSPPKTHALRSTHYASSTKIALACTYKFWEKDGIRGGYSITDRPSRFIYYPSHNFSTGVGVILASYTWNDDAEFFSALTDEKCLDVVLQDLSVVHQVSKEALQKNCSQYVVQKWQLDRHSMGAFAAFTPYQFTDYSRALFENETRVYFAGEHTAHPHAWIETSMKSAIRAAKAMDLDRRKVHVLNEEGEQQQLRKVSSHKSSRFSHLETHHPPAGSSLPSRI
uniref:Amine oxidase n=1 Tax=Strix occidentalis caurina TaxID=311401 RepID=A0A8D0KSU7_STROC